jgi:hypothetical protein
LLVIHGNKRRETRPAKAGIHFDFAFAVRREKQNGFQLALE